MTLRLLSGQAESTTVPAEVLSARRQEGPGESNSPPTFQPEADEPMAQKLRRAGLLQNGEFIIRSFSEG